jgi:sugar-specific transcriptional regulator TrmB
MTLDQLTTACALPETSVRQALERLVGRGLIATIEGTPLSYRFAPPDAVTRDQIERIVEQYRANPLTVIKIMASSAIERVRSAALYTFAEAFRVKRHKSDG